MSACVLLLSDQAVWSDLSVRAGAVARRRFHQAAVYHDLDSAMAWTEGAAQRRMAVEDAVHASPSLMPGGESLAAVQGDPLAPDASDTDAALSLGRQLVETGQAESGLTVIEGALLRRPGHAHAAALAAWAAQRCGHGWLAAMHAAVVIAQRPAKPEGYRLFAEGMQACGQSQLAREAMLQALAIAPFRRDIHAWLRPFMHGEDESYRALGRSLMMALGARVPFTFNGIGYESPGIGWSFPEDWGTWTDGACATLLVQLPEALPALDIEFAVLGRRRPGVPQRFTLLADGERLGEWHLDEDGATQVISARWMPASRRLVSELELRFLIADPMALIEDGRVLDPRRFGIALQWLSIDAHVTRVPQGSLLELDGQAFVSGCYRQILQKDADGAGMSHYLAELSRGVTKLEIIQHLAREAAGVLLAGSDDSAD